MIPIGTTHNQSLPCWAVTYVDTDSHLTTMRTFTQRADAVDFIRYRVLDNRCNIVPDDFKLYYIHREILTTDEVTHIKSGGCK